jgi:hypothetical protein
MPKYVIQIFGLLGAVTGALFCHLSLGTVMGLRLAAHWHPIKDGLFITAPYFLLVLFTLGSWRTPMGARVATLTSLVAAAFAIYCYTRDPRYDDWSDHVIWLLVPQLQIPALAFIALVATAILGTISLLNGSPHSPRPKNNV